MEKTTIDTIKKLALHYESANFLVGDPSWFMHQVEGEWNQELTAFLASTLSFGSRKQFLPKIQLLLDNIHFDNFQFAISNSPSCFYRMYTCGDMFYFLNRLKELLQEYGSLKEFVSKGRNNIDAIDALEAITSWFTGCKPIPKDTSSSCKRLCMFLRWMVRDNSPVDLGVWNDIIDKRTLIIPLDTHVMQQANRLGLSNSMTSSMSNARKITQKLLKIFPDDPLKGDFALFGYGVDDFVKKS